MGGRRSKRWNSCLMWFAASMGAFCLTLLCSRASGNNDVDEERSYLPFSSSTKRPISKSVLEIERKHVFVSTLDGRLSALDVTTQDIELLWSIEADARPLLSSSISKLEIMHEGVPTRYIPSLDGGLYRFNGDSIEAVPISAETLMSSSFRLTDNTMMVGGKDNVVYGLDPQTGEIRYACLAKGCQMFGQSFQSQDNVLIVTRLTQTIRAVDSRTGGEKWNFSVGEHELDYLQGQKHNIVEQCGTMEDNEDEKLCSIDDEDKSIGSDSIEKFLSSIKLAVSDGIVVGVNPDNMQTLSWQYKFKSPVSNVWVLYRGQMRKIDMFGNNNIPGLFSFEPGEQPLHPPLLYVGLHENQLYVQSSAQLQQRMSEATILYSRDKSQGTCGKDIPKVAWKPYLNTAQWRTPSMNNKNNKRQLITMETENHRKDIMDICEDGDNAVAIWHENYPFDNGFYLYPKFSIMETVEDDVYIEAHSNENMPQSVESIFDEVMHVPVTLWNWWKEVMAISIVTSVLMNLILTRVSRAKRQCIQSSNLTQSVSEADNVTTVDKEKDNNTPSRQNSDEYLSRYAADFDHISVLGHGGFGVVFEARNKVDECHYAIKRIALPNSGGAKEKVMREVKALAKLDHVGIVRYFYAWIESPPPCWQEEKDKAWGKCSDSVTSPLKALHSGSFAVGNSSLSKTQVELETTTKKSSKLYLLQPSPLDYLKNPLGATLEVSETDIKRDGSEEFSVHSIQETHWGDEDGDETHWGEKDGDESGSYSCSVGTPKFVSIPEGDLADIKGDICLKEVSSTNYDTDSSSNIPCGNQNCSGCTLCENVIPLEDTNDSFQIVFEDSGCGDKSSKESSHGIDNGIQNCSLDRMLESHHTHCTNKIIFSSSSHLNNTSQSSEHLFHHKCITWGTDDEIAVVEKADNTVSEQADDLNLTDRSKSSHNIPKLYLYIQMQLCRRDTLKHWLESNTLNRDRHTVLDIFDQITSAIEYVHECGLMHRDLKPSNIFFSLDGVVKMGDFGLVTALPEEQNDALFNESPDQKHTAQVGTQLYMSPEQTYGKTYSQKVDIYSLGVILFELLYPFATQMERVSTLIKVKQQHFPERFTREMQKECEFVKQLLSPNPEDRPSAKDILMNVLLKDFENRRMPSRFRSRTVSQHSS